MTTKGEEPASGAQQSWGLDVGGCLSAPIYLPFMALGIALWVGRERSTMCSLSHSGLLQSLPFVGPVPLALFL